MKLSFSWREPELITNSREDDRLAKKGGVETGEPLLLKLSRRVTDWLLQRQRSRHAADFMAFDRSVLLFTKRLIANAV